VTPDGRREKVIQRVNRPTFERMKPPLVEVCRYISFEGLREALAAARLRVIPQARLAPDHQRIVCPGRSLTSESKP